VVKLLEDGVNKEPFRAKTLPPVDNRFGRSDKLIARSRERFATPRAVVEEKLRRWMTQEDPLPERSREKRGPQGR
jgi:hypothetical protein